jgi:hypothetical protein
MILIRNLAGRSGKGDFFNFIPLFFVIAFFIMPHEVSPFDASFHDKPTKAEVIQRTLKDIHDEVVQMGSYDDEDFIKREFWFELDGVEENKEEHILVMEHNDGINLRMTVQVTYFTKNKRRIVRYAEDTKSVFCLVKGPVFEIDRSDYSDDEMEKILPGILNGIRVEKKILKLIEKK